MEIAVSCVIEAQPRLVMQCFNFLLSLKAAKVFDDAAVFVHHTGLDDDIVNVYRELGCRVVEIEPFGSGNARYCNKLQQLWSKELDSFDYTILCDVDLAVRESPLILATGGVLRAKPVDTSNPPLGDLKALFEAAGLPTPA